MPENEKIPSIIKKIVLSDATFEGADLSARTIEPTFVNFFFGKNGSGKTTIGRQIRDDIGIEYSDGRQRTDYEVRVYNQDFVDDHFQTYDKLKGVFRISKTGKQAEETISDYERKQKDAQGVVDNTNEELSKNRAALGEVETQFQNDCWRNARDLRDPYKPLLKGYLKAEPFSKKVLETTPSDCDLAELQQLYQTAFITDLRYYPFFNTFKEGALDIGVLPSCELLEEPIESRSDTQFSRFVKAINAADWVKAGHDMFHGGDGRCPYCQQALPADFEEQLAAVFDQQYLADVQRVRDFRNTYHTYMGNLFRIFSDNIAGETLPTLDIQKYKARLDAFASKVKNNLTLIDSKIEKPTSVVEIEDVTPDLLDLNYYVEQFNEAIYQNNQNFKEREENQKKFLPMLWGLIAFRLEGDVESYRLKLDKISQEYKELLGKIAVHKAIVDDYASRIKALAAEATSVQPAIDEINTLLDESGFEGFKIVRSDKVKDGYKIVRRDKSTAVRLSEGERNFIAFLYFYHTVKGSLSSDGIVRDKIVVVDDPISSMDSNAIFLVSSLVREMIEVCNNNVNYGERGVQGDYIKQLFVMTHNAYFHKVITYNQVSRYQSVNFYLVDKLDNTSSVTLCWDYSKTSAGDMVNINPVKNSYAALWAEYRDLQSALPLLNVMHRILDYYFLDICGYDGLTIRQRILVTGRKNFVTENPDGSEDRTKLQLASHLLEFISAGVSDDVHFVTPSCDVEKLKKVFEMIFKEMGQIQHYNMMIERAR